jgi:hypothetical protein
VGEFHGQQLRLGVNGPRGAGVPFSRCLKFHARSAIACQIERRTLRTGALDPLHVVACLLRLR